jgi:hypothetical protein
VELRLDEVDPLSARAEITLDGTLAIVLHLRLGMRRPANRNPLEDAPTIELGPTPMSPDVERLDGATGWIAPPAAINLFPALTAALGVERVHALAVASSVVGMVCPGRLSAFSALSIDFVDGDSAKRGLGWRARVPDHRYRRLEIEVAGSGLRGELKALVRPAPVEPPTMGDLMALVTPGEFLGRTALVVGGSRGLGAVAGKLLAAGGADVTLTYSVGREEAGAVAADIGAGGGRARVLACDVLRDLSPLGETLASATHVYYFATPRISRQGASVSMATFDEFNAVYLARFQDLCAHALAASSRSIRVFYPSSVAVEAPPRGMVEYAMAKAAGEVLCGALTRSNPRLMISAPRLPRVLTDQTALAIAVRVEDAAAVLLPLLRAEAA